jgi:hypothetical protein
MFDKPYAFQKLGNTYTLLADPVRRINYRFKARFRTYFVILEVYSFDVVAIKYCDVKDKGAYNAFDKIFNDGDALRVIATCLFIMLDYWKRYPTATFAFYAVPRDLPSILINQKQLNKNEAEKFIERYRSVRFTIYKYAMVNLFPPKSFIQIQDSKNSLYLLLNKKQKNSQAIIKQFTKYLFDNHNIIFEPDGKS